MCVVVVVVGAMTVALAGDFDDGAVEEGLALAEEDVEVGWSWTGVTMEETNAEIGRAMVKNCGWC